MASTRSNPSLLLPSTFRSCSTLAALIKWHRRSPRLLRSLTSVIQADRQHGTITLLTLPSCQATVRASFSASAASSFCLCDKIRAMMIMINYIDRFSLPWRTSPYPWQIGCFKLEAEGRKRPYGFWRCTDKIWTVLRIVTVTISYYSYCSLLQKSLLVILPFSVLSLTLWAQELQKKAGGFFGLQGLIQTAVNFIERIYHTGS